jgi:hypothetical protein
MALHFGSPGCWRVHGQAVVLNGCDCCGVFTSVVQLPLPPSPPSL